MKKTLIALLTIVTLVTVQAQTTNIADIVNSDNVKQSAISFIQGVESNKNLTLALYPSYAPNIVVNGQKTQWGAGVALLTTATVIPSLADSTVAEHVIGGLRLDWLGNQFFASTVAVGLKGDMQLWGHNFTGFVESGANIPVSGTGQDGNVGAMYGGGAKTTVLTFGTRADGTKAGSLDVFVGAEKWTQFPGVVYHAGGAVTWSF